jgi:hypothetical protein
MRRLARISLGLLGLALIAPGVVRAQYAPSGVPSGYQTAASPSAMPAPAPAPAPAVEAPHKHKGKVLCASCAAKMKANGPSNLPPGTIVGCEHSKNGVCTACRAALNMPGQFIMAAGQPAEAPGRAVASSSPTPNGAVYAARPGQAPLDDQGMGEPAPVGVVQANFSQGGPMMGAPAPAAAYAPQAMAPGRAVAESANANAGNDPYQVKSKPFPRPHILGHLFGWSGIGAEKAEAKAFKKSEAHAMITYDENGKAPVDELPASMVFGKKR